MSTDHEDFTKFAKFAVQQNGDALRHVPKRQGSCADHTSISTEAVQTRRRRAVQHVPKNISVLACFGAIARLAVQQKGRGRRVYFGDLDCKRTGGKQAAVSGAHSSPVLTPG